ncbi:hypothetical protein ABZ470_19605 [Streptosporangium sp. NPDC020072]|uniref:hypothetical protein n=1 Tax=Streptosporangium sp. NPDC020072 TaxID=3154788 RepID=UPI00343E331E
MPVWDTDYWTIERKVTHFSQGCGCLHTGDPSEASKCNQEEPAMLDGEKMREGRSTPILIVKQSIEADQLSSLKKVPRHLRIAAQPLHEIHIIAKIFGWSGNRVSQRRYVDMDRFGPSIDVCLVSAVLDVTHQCIRSF